MIFYPIAVLMLAGVREILIITRSLDIPSFKRVWRRQRTRARVPSSEKPHGIADAFTIGRDFIEGHQVALILGDNIFFGGTLRSILRRRSRFNRGAVRFRLRSLRSPSALASSGWTVARSR